MFHIVTAFLKLNIHIFLSSVNAHYITDIHAVKNKLELSTCKSGVLVSVTMFIESSLCCLNVSLLICVIWYVDHPNHQIVLL